MSFILATDTSCDIFRSELRERNIEYKPLIYTIDGNENFDEFSSDAEYKAFYDEIRAGKMPTTSQINIAEHEDFFTELLNKYEGDLIHITLSSGLSSTYASACTAAETVMRKTGRKIYVVDSLQATIGQRQVVDEAQRLRDGGVDAETAAAKLKDFVAHLHTWFMPYDLMHLKRGGRVSGPAAYIGTALNIKPILFINKVGGLSVVKKKIGVDKCLADMTASFVRDAVPEARTVYIASADSDHAEALKQRIEHARPDCKVVIGWIGPVIGAHTGCGAVGLSFLSPILREI